jgi:hypothetical protein
VYFDRPFEDEKKNPVCSGVNLNCPRGAVVKKAFMFYLIVKGTKNISRIKIHGPFCFDWKIRQSSRDCVGVFYRYL